MAGFYSWTGLASPRAPSRRFGLRNQHWCSVEQLEGRVLLTGGLGLDDCLLDTGLVNLQPCASEATAETSRSEMAAGIESPWRTVRCGNDALSESGTRGVVPPAVSIATVPTRPSDARPTAGGLPSECSAEDRAPDDGTPDNGTPDDGTPDDGTPDDGTPDDGTPDDGTPDNGTPDNGTPDNGTPDNGTPDDGTPDDGPTELTQAPCECEKHAGGASPAAEEDPLDSGVGATSDHESDSLFTPRTDAPGGPTNNLSRPSGDLAAPVDSKLIPRHSAQASTTVETVSTEVAGAATPRSGVDQVFHYYDPSHSTLGTIGPSLTEQSLENQAVRDTFMDFALIPPVAGRTVADRNASPPVTRGDQVLPASRLTAAASPAPVSPATLARAQEVARSVDAILAELNTADLPPAPAPEPVRGASPTATVAAADSGADSGAEPAVTNHGTVRLGFLALGSLVLGSRWTPLSRGLFAVEQSGRWRWLAQFRFQFGSKKR